MTLTAFIDEALRERLARTRSIVHPVRVCG